MIVRRTQLRTKLQVVVRRLTPHLQPHELEQIDISLHGLVGPLDGVLLNVLLVGLLVLDTDHHLPATIPTRPAPRFGTQHTNGNPNRFSTRPGLQSYQLRLRWCKQRIS